MGVLVKSWYSLLFILLLLLFTYGNLYDYYLDDILNLNKEGKYQVFGKAFNISQNSFYLDLGNSYIKVTGSGIKKPIYGETVLYINHEKGGTMELIDYHNYNYNYILYTISFFALIVFLILFFKEWELTLGGFKDA